MRRNYPEYIKKYVKERLNLEDTKENDDYINTLMPNEVFECVLEWNGICNYGETLKVWVKDIYGVDLNAKSIS